MNYKNIDLDSHEIETNIIDPLSFKTLLLEIDCNIQNINYNTVKRQFESDLNRITWQAIEIFNNNVNNIIRKAK